MMDIKIAAAAVMRADGATLLVRKRGTDAFMQPGGKIDAGETPVVALCRELYEELGIQITADAAEYLGFYQAPAANEVGSTVSAEMFRIEVDVEIAAQAEIEEAIWVDWQAADQLTLAPLTRDKVLPAIWGSVEAGA